MSAKSSFAPKQFAEIKQHIDAGDTTSVIGIPGTGISVFMKQLAQQPFGRMIYVDVFSLPELSAKEFYAALNERLGGQPVQGEVIDIVHNCIDRLKQLTAQRDEPVVLVISGFDKLADAFSLDFFRYLRSLKSVDQNNIVFVFGICRRLETILPTELTNLDLRLFNTIYYLPRYSQDDLRYLLDTYGPKLHQDDSTFTEAVHLSGGHFQFLQLILQSEHRQQLASDPFIKLSFENIWSHLSTAQKAIVRKVAFDHTMTKADEYLLNVGIIQRTGEQVSLFSPLFAECVRAYSAPKLPIKERRLLAILKKNQGRVVSKREIYDAVWLGQDIGSEWALNALIYRLRKHPAFTAQNFSIENHKKLGYSLTKNR